jgi:hypothetical protein
MYTNRAGHILYMLCRPTNSIQGGTEKDRKGLGTEDPGQGAWDWDRQTDSQTDRQNDGQAFFAAPPDLPIQNSGLQPSDRITIPRHKYILTCLVQDQKKRFPHRIRCLTSDLAGPQIPDTSRKSQSLDTPLQTSTMCLSSTKKTPLIRGTGCLCNSKKSLAPWNSRN